MLLVRIASTVASLIRGRGYYSKYERLYKRELKEIPSFSLLSELVNGKILDIACGIGYLSMLFQDYVGSDMSREALLIAKKRSKADFVMAAASHLPFRSGAFDGCISYDSVEHFQDLDDILEEMKRAANRVIISLVDFSSYYRYFTFDVTHRKLYYAIEVRALMRKYFHTVRLFRTSGIFLVPRTFNSFLAKWFPNQIVLEGSD